MASCASTPVTALPSTAQSSSPVEHQDSDGAAVHDIEAQVSLPENRIDKWSSWQKLAKRYSSDQFQVQGSGCCSCLQSRRAKCCAGSSILVVVALLITVFMCFLKDPTWELQALSVDPADLNKMIQAFTDPNFNSTLTLPLNTTVELDNQNAWGAHVGEGSFTVTHDGHLLASVVTLPSQIRAYSSGITKAEATSVITPALSQLMLNELSSSNFQMQVEVDGKLPAHLFGFIHFQVRVKCNVDVDVLQLVQDSNKLIKKHQCKYGL